MARGSIIFTDLHRYLVGWNTDGWFGCREDGECTEYAEREKELAGLIEVWEATGSAAADEEAVELDAVEESDGVDPLLVGVLEDAAIDRELGQFGLRF